jgi:hypothetical protein
MFVIKILNDIWERAVKFGTAVLFINTTIKYVAVTIYVPEFIPEKSRRTDSGSKNNLSFKAEFASNI